MEGGDFMNLYVQRFPSWLFRSYKIRISHRFTKDSEILLKHVGHGHKAVECINRIHHEYTANNKNGVTPLV
jgi:hypothetical protein